MRRLLALVALVLAVSVRNAQATPITFDFEELALSGASGVATVTSTKSGLTVTVTRADGANIGVQDLNSPNTQVSDFGHRNLSNFLGPGNATSAQAALIFTFSAPITIAAISFGDLGGTFPHDDDSPVVWTAFSGLNGTGVNLGSVSVAYPADLGFLDQGNAAIRSAVIGAGGIQSLTISSGGTAPGTLYFDNLRVDTVDTAAVPEPGTLTLIGLGSAYLIRRRQRNCR
jgi:PEP-CTERM motif